MTMVHLRSRVHEGRLFGAAKPSHVIPRGGWALLIAGAWTLVAFSVPTEKVWQLAVSLTRLVFLYFKTGARG